MRPPPSPPCSSTLAGRPPQHLVRILDGAGVHADRDGPPRPLDAHGGQRPLVEERDAAARHPGVGRCLGQPDRHRAPAYLVEPYLGGDRHRRRPAHVTGNLRPQARHRLPAHGDERAWALGDHSCDRGPSVDRLVVPGAPERVEVRGAAADLHEEARRGAVGRGRPFDADAFLATDAERLHIDRRERQRRQPYVEQQRVAAHLVRRRERRCRRRRERKRRHLRHGRRRRRRGRGRGRGRGGDRWRRWLDGPERDGGEPVCPQWSGGDQPTGDHRAGQDRAAEDGHPVPATVTPPGAASAGQQALNVDVLIGGHGPQGLGQGRVQVRHGVSVGSSAARRRPSGHGGWSAPAWPGCVPSRPSSA